MIEMVVQHGDLTKATVDAIVNPANSFGLMGGGVAGVIKRVGGDVIETAARHHAPIPVGAAIATTAGRLGVRYVIHAPTMARPAQPTDADTVAQATHAALACADSLQLSSVAIPGMGTGVGRVPVDAAAEAIAKAIRRFSATHLVRVVLIDIQAEMVAAFRRALTQDHSDPGR